jgi:putative hydrolase of the HAD superfamily
MRKALRRLDAEKYFQFFTSSKDLGFEKPDPQFFLALAKTIGFNAEECVHTGNIYEKDITGAKSSGMFTVFFNQKKRTGVFPDADVVINWMQELPDAIEKLLLFY